MVRSALNPSLELLGVLLTMLDDRTRLSREVSEQVKGHFGEAVFRTYIPRRIRLAEAASFGEPIEIFDRMNRGAIAYRRLAEEAARQAPLPAGRAPMTSRRGGTGPGSEHPHSHRRAPGGVALPRDTGQPGGAQPRPAPHPLQRGQPGGPGPVDHRGGPAPTRRGPGVRVRVRPHLRGTPLARRPDGGPGDHPRPGPARRRHRFPGAGAGREPPTRRPHAPGGGDRLQGSSWTGMG